MCYALESITNPITMSKCGLNKLTNSGLFFYMDWAPPTFTKAQVKKWVREKALDNAAGENLRNPCPPGCKWKVKVRTQLHAVEYWEGTFLENGKTKYYVTARCDYTVLFICQKKFALPEELRNLLDK